MFVGEGLVAIALTVVITGVIPWREATREKLSKLVKRQPAVAQ